MKGDTLSRSWLAPEGWLELTLLRGLRTAAAYTTAPDGWIGVASSGEPGQNTEAIISAWANDTRPSTLSRTSVTCMLRFDVLLVFDGVRKGLVTGAALQR